MYEEYEEIMGRYQKIIGRKLRVLRKSLGLSQKQFAEKIPGKVDYTYIGKIERGEQCPSIRMLGKICYAFSVPLVYFFPQGFPQGEEMKLEDVEFLRDSHEAKPIGRKIAKLVLLHFKREEK